MLPVLTDSFDRMAGALARFDDGRGRKLLSVGAVGSFAIAWLLPRLAAFEAAHPEVDLGSAPTTTGSTSPRKGWISRSGSETAPGTEPRLRCCSGRR